MHLKLFRFVLHTRRRTWHTLRSVEQRWRCDQNTMKGARVRAYGKQNKNANCMSNSAAAQCRSNCKRNFGGCFASSLTAAAKERERESESESSWQRERTASESGI